MGEIYTLPAEEGQLHGALGPRALGQQAGLWGALAGVLDSCHSKLL